MNKRVFITISFVVLLIFSACKSKQSMSGKQPKAKSVEQFISFAQNAEPKFEAVSTTNVQLSFTQGDKTQKVGATLRMKTDSVIVLSISPFMGIELFSFEFYTDKCLIYDKINRLYAVESYEYLYYNYGVELDFYSLQSLFSAQIFGIENKKIDPRKSKLLHLDDSKTALCYDSEKFTQEFYVYSNYEMSKMLIKQKNNEMELHVHYGDYYAKKESRFPQDLELIFFNGAVNMMSLKMKIQKLNFNSQAKIVLSRPERYSQVSLNQIIK